MTFLLRMILVSHAFAEGASSPSEKEVNNYSGPQGPSPGLDLDRRVTLAGTPVESLDGLHRPAWGVEGGDLKWGNCRDAVGIHQHRRRWRIGASPAATKRGSSREKMVGDKLEFCLVKLASH